MKAKLRWKMEPRETGLRSIGSGPRGYFYHDGEKVYARVCAHGGNWARPMAGWYWVAGWDSDVPYQNTSGSPCETIDEAKTQAAEYVRQNSIA
ncbi:MAG: hypothetical protein WA003_15740 [Desulfuromonadaceae bacterium]